MDQNIAGPHLSQMAADFRLTVRERDARLGGLVQLCFFVTSGVCSVLLGPFAQIGNKSRILASLMLLTSFASFSSSFSTEGRSGFFWFLMSRVTSGVAVGASLPIIFALVGDAVSKHQRTIASGAVGSSAAAGAALGQVVSAFMASWRYPYRAHGIFSIICAFGILTIFESHMKPGNLFSNFGLSISPKQTEKKNSLHFWGEVPEPRGFKMEQLQWSKFSEILKIESNRLIFLQAIPGCVGWSVISTFLADFLITDRSLTKTQATSVLAVFGLSCLAFSIFGSSLGQHIYNQHRKWLPKFISGSSFLGSFPIMLLVISAGTDSKSQPAGQIGGRMVLTYLLAFLSALQAIPGPNIKGLVMSVNSADDRAVVFAFFQLVDSLGKACGPMLVCILEWAFGSRTLGFCLAFTCWWLSSLIILQLEHCLSRDINKADSLRSFGKDV